MSVPDPLTDQEALDDAAASYQLTGEQAMQLAAKEGLVRALAEEEGAPLVLKGGTLLSHVSGSPRVSIADVDYAQPEAHEEDLDVATVRQMATIDRSATQAFRIDGGHVSTATVALGPQTATWSRVSTCPSHLPT